MISRFRVFPKLAVPIIRLTIFGSHIGFPFSGKTTISEQVARQHEDPHKKQVYNLQTTRRYVWSLGSDLTLLGLRASGVGVDRTGCVADVFGLLILQGVWVKQTLCM